MWSLGRFSGWNSGDLTSVLGRGNDWGGSKDCTGSVCVLGWDREATGERGRRSQATAAAAGVAATARLWLVLGNKQPRELSSGAWRRRRSALGMMVLAEKGSSSCNIQW
jgi:hypothetical protein